MPEIRKNGKYSLNDKDKQKLDEINDKLINYEKELRYYYDKYEFKPSKYGYIYINIDIVVISGKKQICYKIGFTKDMKKRLKDAQKINKIQNEFYLFLSLEPDF